MKTLWRLGLGILFLLTGVVIMLTGCGTSPSVSFNNEIRPILNAKCVNCHGGVRRAGNLSLLFRSEALGAGDSGRVAILPGEPEGSELIGRINHPDPEKRMPRDGDPLTVEEIELFERWIKQGAEWEQHWAYIPPSLAEPPAVTGNGSPVGPIDRFILDKLNEQGLQPAGPASRNTLIRRVSLDLTGLPPKPEEVDAFVNDGAPDAYEKVVDRLLSSPGYGERWAGMWLDLARYADTKGYERDPGREIWHYRDWLIRAFNRDLPFDQFTVEQLAGDMLPEPTSDQFVATAFHRNTMNNDEGGTDNEEYRTAAVIDRVNTTWDVWLGTTYSCTQCHGHPYDPFRQHEYYEVLSFFNNTRDEDTPTDAPVFRFFEDSDWVEIRRIQDWIEKHAAGDDAQKQDKGREVVDLIRFAEPKIHPHYFEIVRNGTHADTKYLEMYRDGLAILRDFDLSGKVQLLVNLNWAKDGTSFEIRLDDLDGPLFLRTRLGENQKGHYLFDVGPVEGRHDLYLRFDNASLEPDIGTASFLYFILLEAFPGAGQNGYQDIRQALLRLLDQKTPSVPILVENREGFRRKTRLFERGNWLVKGEPVDPGVPDALTFSDEPPRDRLGFARWVVAVENPLTARVAVNRFWEQIFGTGLVETVEDFGTRGTPPSHPELLDWLAVQFSTEYKWSVKRLLKEIVLSSTYRQSAAASATALEV
ncbi:MAG: DUF1549 domain-containing protein, partial [Acidobacteriota bacterium]